MPLPRAAFELPEGAGCLSSSGTGGAEGAASALLLPGMGGADGVVCSPPEADSAGKSPKQMGQDAAG